MHFFSPRHSANGSGSVFGLSKTFFGAALLFGTGSLRGQTMPIVSQAALDSLAHPVVVSGGEAMRFESTTLTVGSLDEDAAPAAHTFRWRNEGTTPLVVTRVETSCGCVRADFSKAPVSPGEWGEIAVAYRPKGHPGFFRRRILVFTQLSARQPSAVLELTGRVIPSLRPTADYPCVMGALRLKQQSVRIEGDRRQSERIECFNAGDEPLTIRADSRLLPEYLRFECEPTRIDPGSTADLVIRFDPAHAAAELPRQLPILLEGLSLPPSQRTLQVVFGPRS